MQQPAKCNNLLTLELDKLFWKYLKAIVKDDVCLNNLVNIANTCINLGYWLPYFKMLSSIIIPKSNKDSPKMFCPIFLLNTIGKLIEKVIGKRLQFQVISKNFIHQCQLGSLKQWSTTDVEIVLTHFIRAVWVKNLLTSTLTFDITQFFPSLNY